MFFRVFFGCREAVIRLRNQLLCLSTWWETKSDGRELISFLLFVTSSHKEHFDIQFIRSARVSVSLIFTIINLRQLKQDGGSNRSPIIHGEVEDFSTGRFGPRYFLRFTSDYSHPITFEASNNSYFCFRLCSCFSRIRLHPINPVKRTSPSVAISPPESVQSKQ